MLMDEIMSNDVVNRKRNIFTDSRNHYIAMNFVYQQKESDFGGQK